MTNFYTATGNELQIPLMKGISDELMQVNTRDDRKRWWEVIDRSTGEVVSTDKWEYNEETGCVCIHDTEPFHEYTRQLFSLHHLGSGPYVQCCDKWLEGF